MLSSSSTNTLEFTDANTYGGGTTINGGTLQVANVSGSATGTNSVSVNNGGTLAGSLSPSQGFITGAVTVNSGGTISASNGNTLTLSGGLTFGSGPTSSTNSTFNLSGAASANALVATSGGTNSLVVNGTNAVTVTGTPSVGTYELFSVAGAAPSVGSFSLASAPAGMSYMISITSNQVDLQVGSIDESGTGSFGGTVLSTSVPNGGSYAGISSTTATKLSNSPNPGIEGTVATILIGTNNQGVTVTPSMTWRSRTLAETPGDDGAANGNGFVNGTPTTPCRSSATWSICSAWRAVRSGATDVAPVPTDPFAFRNELQPGHVELRREPTETRSPRAAICILRLCVGGAWENTIVPDLPSPAAPRQRIKARRSSRHRRGRRASGQFQPADSRFLLGLGQHERRERFEHCELRRRLGRRTPPTTKPGPSSITTANSPSCQNHRHSSCSRSARRLLAGEYYVGERRS